MWKKRKLINKCEAPLTPTYSAFHLPDGSLNHIGKKYYMEQKRRERAAKRARNAKGEEK